MRKEEIAGKEGMSKQKPPNDAKSNPKKPPPSPSNADMPRPVQPQPTPSAVAAKLSRHAEEAHKLREKQLCTALTSLETEKEARAKEKKEKEALVEQTVGERDAALAELKLVREQLTAQETVYSSTMENLRGTVQSLQILARKLADGARCERRRVVDRMEEDDGFTPDFDFWATGSQASGSLSQSQSQPGASQSSAVPIASPPASQTASAPPPRAEPFLEPDLRREFGVLITETLDVLSRSEAFDRCISDDGPKITAQCVAILASAPAFQHLSAYVWQAVGHDLWLSMSIYRSQKLLVRRETTTAGFFGILVQKRNEWSRGIFRILLERGVSTLPDHLHVLFTAAFCEELCRQALYSKLGSIATFHEIVHDALPDAAADKPALVYCLGFAAFSLLRLAVRYHSTAKWSSIHALVRLVTHSSVHDSDIKDRDVLAYLQDRGRSLVTIPHKRLFDFFLDKTERIRQLSFDDQCKPGHWERLADELIATIPTFVTVPATHAAHLPFFSKKLCSAMLSLWTRAGARRVADALLAKEGETVGHGAQPLRRELGTAEPMDTGAPPRDDFYELDEDDDDDDIPLSIV